MAAKILADNLTGREKAFSKKNMLVITTGPMTGSGAPSSSRFNISTLSPQTGYLTSSNCGGNFGYYLKKAGLDALIITGQCKKHTWIEIKSTHNRRERTVYGHRGGSRGRLYYMITTFEERPWDARDPHETTFMAFE